MLVNMNDILRSAKKGGYAVGFFNAVNVEMAIAIIRQAEAMRAPVVIGTAESLLPYMGLNEVAQYLLPLAGKAKVPVAVHYDHGLTFDGCLRALKAGFTSIMYDCSVCTYEENMHHTYDMVKVCHAMGIPVEGELGHVGDNEGAGKLDNPRDFYTDPKKAARFVKETGVDALAVAVGNAHGNYRFPPKLDFERISEIEAATRIPLVLHGGSGLPAEDISNAVSRGICMINIFTELESAGFAGAKRAMDDGVTVLTKMIPYEIKEMRKVVEEKITLFGSAGKA